MKTQSEPKDQAKTGYTPYLWLITGALLLLLANGRWIIPAATWLSFVFFIRFLRTQTHPWKTVLCALSYIAVYMIAWYGMVPVPGVLYYVLAGSIGLVMFLPLLADKFITHRVTGFLATLVFPLAFTTVEYVVSLLNPFGTWSFLGYTQFGNLPLMQIVSITGIYGITFLIAWFASVINWAWEQEFDWPNISRGIKLFAGVMVAVLLFGGFSLTFFAPKSDEVKVAGVLTALDDSGETEENATISELLEFHLPRYEIMHDDLFSKSRIAAESGAKIVSWHEGAGLILKEDEPAFLDRGKRVAQEEQIYLVLAYITSLHTDETLLPEKKLFENIVVIIGPGGELLSTHQKSIPIPGSEALMYVKGADEVPVVDTPYGRISSTICFENDFPAFTRKIGMAGVDFFFNPSSDWLAIDPYHTEMQAFRAIENGTSTLRTARDGLSAAYDYQGRTLASMDFFKNEDMIFSAHLPVKGITTIYSRIGDAFSWLCAAGFIMISVTALRRRKDSDIA